MFKREYPIAMEQIGSLWATDTWGSVHAKSRVLFGPLRSDWFWSAFAFSLPTSY
jgi:hypothetical protein